MPKVTTIFPYHSRKLKYQKHLGRILDEWFNSTEHINSKISKCDKSIGIIKKLSISFPRNALLMI